MSILKVNTIQDKGGNTLLVSDGAGTISSGGAITNTPSFGAEQSGSQSIANDTNVKLQCDTENWDTDSAYDNSTNYRFTVPSGKGGKYYIQAHVQIPGIDDTELGQIMLYKNGSVINQSYVRNHASGNNDIFQMITAITYSLAEGDYIEVYVYQNSGEAQNATNGYFTAHKLIGV